MAMAQYRALHPKTRADLLAGLPAIIKATEDRGSYILAARMLIFYARLLQVEEELFCARAE
jgi:hypothetical protein